jgi:hypothetical protein
MTPWTAVRFVASPSEAGRLTQPVSVAHPV